jgi:hypothetical protein
MIYQFKITLKDIEPPIWRRIQIPQSYSFWDLHVALQDAMGWLDYHLHIFRIINPETDQFDEIGIPDDEAFEDELPCLPGWELPISHYFEKSGARAEYEYDFGDCWEHEIILEEIVNRVPKQKYPICLAGERACPPEDCGGSLGYLDLLDTIKNPDDEEFESTMEWLGGSFDPELFDPKNVHFDNPQMRWQKAFRDL